MQALQKLQRESAYTCSALMNQIAGQVGAVKTAVDQAKAEIILVKTAVNAVTTAVQAVTTATTDGTQKTSITGVNIPPGAFATRSADELPVADATVRAAYDADGETIPTAKVRMSNVDRERMDLQWAGVWVLAGIMLVNLFAPLWNRAWKWWQE